jgi:hypothetical protein
MSMSIKEEMLMADYDPMTVLNGEEGGGIKSNRTWLYAHLEEIARNLKKATGLETEVLPAPNKSMQVQYQATFKDAEGIVVDRAKVYVEGLPVETLAQRATDAFLEQLNPPQ